MSQLLEILAQAALAAPRAAEMQSRRYGLFIGTVSNNSDPLNKRRVRVTTGPKGGLTETDWLWPMRLIPYYDPPMPRVAVDQVVCAFLDGNPHDGVWLGTIINQTNPEADQSDPINDNSQTIPGDSDETIGGKYVHTVTKDEERRTDLNTTVSVGKTLTLQNDAGASLTLHESGAVILEDKWRNKLVLGGASGGLDQPSDFVWNTISGDVRWDLGGNSLEIYNADDVTIENKSVTTIGAIDDRGDHLTSRGWP